MTDSNSETITTAPEVQKLERLQTFEKEHKDALKRAVTLNIPYAVADPEEPSKGKEEGSSSGEKVIDNRNKIKDDEKPKSESARGTNWNEVVGLLFDKSESGKLELKRDTAVPK